MYIARDVVPEIEKWIGREKIIILKGARQVGKTTILKHLRDRLDSAGNRCEYFSADFELHNPIFKDPRLFVQFVKDRFAGEFAYIFIDEFQYITDAGLYLKVVFDQLKECCQLIVSGSSSLEITKNSEFLTGRKVAFHIKTLSFREFARHKSALKTVPSLSFDNMNDIEDFNKIYGDELKRCLVEYISFGGYPEIVLTASLEEKRLLLKELISTYIQKDVAGFLHVGNTSGFNHLLKMLVSQSGNLVNKHELSSSLNLSCDTVNKYCDILEGTYVLKFLRPFYSNVRKELSKMPKVYFSDFGIARIFTNRDIVNSYFEINGSDIENFVFNELMERYGDDSIYFHRTISKSEIDFIVESDSRLIPVEVKFTNSPRSLPLAMRNFSKNYENVARNIVVTKNQMSGDGFHAIPAYLLPFVTALA